MHSLTHFRAVLFLMVPAVIITFTIGLPSHSQENTKPQTSGSLVGKRLPDFTLADLNGKRVNLSDFSGKVILLDFWATWCPDCREVVSHIQEMFARSRITGLAVVTVSVDTKSETVKLFMEKNGYTFPVLMASKDTWTVYQVRSIPTVYLIDRSGIVSGVFVEYGIKGVPELEAQVKGLLGPSAVTPPK